VVVPHSDSASVKGGNAAPRKNRKATSFVPNQTKSKKKVFQQKQVQQKPKESVWGHHEQVCISTKGSTTSTKFDFMFCFEEQ
jgi:hypothetical protein